MVGSAIWVLRKAVRRLSRSCLAPSHNGKVNRSFQRGAHEYRTGLEGVRRDREDDPLLRGGRIDTAAGSARQWLPGLRLRRREPARLRAPGERSRLLYGGDPAIAAPLER